MGPGVREEDVLGADVAVDEIREGLPSSPGGGVGVREGGGGVAHGPSGDLLRDPLLVLRAPLEAGDRRNAL